jgi:hypothetical protein
MEMRLERVLGSCQQNWVSIRTLILEWTSRFSPIARIKCYGDDFPVNKEE